MLTAFVTSSLDYRRECELLCHRVFQSRIGDIWVLGVFGLWKVIGASAQIETIF